jgi:hypothetical protein
LALKRGVILFYNLAPPCLFAAYLECPIVTKSVLCWLVVEVNTRFRLRHLVFCESFVFEIITDIGLAAINSVEFVGVVLVLSLSGNDPFVSALLRKHL